MEAIVLQYRGEALRVFELGELPLEVGSGAGCDIVVHDPEVADRHLLVRREGTRVLACDLRRPGASPKPLGPGEELALSPRHSIVRIPDVPTASRPVPGRTEPIAVDGAGTPALSLLVGRGNDARRIPIGARPITLGSGPDCDVVLTDRAVSQRHCRIEPGGDGPLVRDLGSRNGTFVDGVRSFVARIGPGTRLRIGRTDLLAVARGESGDARSDGIVAASPCMLAVLGLVERYARLTFPVLITGETGSGKEGIARALHLRGPRRGRPFVALNAGGLPRDLVESELFGHERGAFTGAVAARKGVFEQAHGGTLFLDEIGELPLALQARLLRVLETREVRRVGAEHDVRVDVRVVCATHRDLHEMVARGAFRQDLLYRINALALAIPPLRERPEDVRALAEHFLASVREEVGPRELSRAAIDRLLTYDWPGNARELRNVIQSAAAATAGVVIDVGDVEEALARVSGRRALERSGEVPTEVLVALYGSISAAARATGIPRSTLRDRLRRGR